MHAYHQDKQMPGYRAPKLGSAAPNSLFDCLTNHPFSTTYNSIIIKDIKIIVKKGKAMAEYFTERKALQMTLESLLEQRALLRRQYVDQDKQLGLDIKQILARVRELDQAEGNEEPLLAEGAENGTVGMNVEVMERLKGRKTHTRHDYETVANHVETILREMSALTLNELCDELKRRSGVEFASPYIGIHKTIKHLPQVKVQKDGRKLVFSLAT
jgi:hypothetical protein